MEKGGFAARLKEVRAAPASRPAVQAAPSAPPAGPAASPSGSPTPSPSAASEGGGRTPSAAPPVPAREAPAASDVARTPSAGASPPSAGLAVWFWDELRLGLHGQVRRVWAPIGEEVAQRLQIQYVWSHLVLAVNPLRGEVRWRWVSNLKGATLAPVVSEWFGADAEVVLVWDGAPGHHSEVMETTGVRRAFLLPYSPELDPAERVFRAIRPEVEGEVYATLADKQAIVEAWLREFAADPARVRSLTAWSWLREQIELAA